MFRVTGASVESGGCRIGDEGTIAVCLFVCLF